MKNQILILGLIFAMVSSKGADTGATSSVSGPRGKTPAVEQSSAPIGSARMLPDETIILNLRAETGSAVGDAQFVYRKDHPRYKMVLRHISPIKVGEEKLVLSFPEHV